MENTSTKSPIPIDALKCPCCSATLDASEPIGETTNNKNAKPKPGDLTVCFFCATLCKFTDDLGLTAYTKEEFRKLPLKTALSVAKVVEAIRASNKKLS